MKHSPEINRLIAADRERFSAFTNVDFQRTQFWCTAAAIAADVPRRLGPDVAPRELKEDKRRSRKMRAGYLTLWGLYHRWMNVPEPPKWTDRSVIVANSIVARVGTTVRWEIQVSYLIDVNLKRMDRLVQFSDLATLDDMGKWYRHHADLLTWELEHLHRVRDYISSQDGGLPIDSQELSI